MLIFFFNDTATTEIYTLSLHELFRSPGLEELVQRNLEEQRLSFSTDLRDAIQKAEEKALHFRSEEHTSELQSRRDLVCRLLLEKKKKITKQTISKTSHHLLKYDSLIS